MQNLYTTIIVIANLEENPNTPFATDGIVGKVNINALSLQTILY